MGAGEGGVSLVGAALRVLRGVLTAEVDGLAAVVECVVEVPASSADGFRGEGTSGEVDSDSCGAGVVIPVVVGASAVPAVTGSEALLVEGRGASSSIFTVLLLEATVCGSGV